MRLGAGSETFDRRAQVLFAEMCIPRTHLDGFVSGELLDDLHVFAAHGEPGTKRMPRRLPNFL